MDVLSPDVLWIDGRCYRVPILDPTVSPSEELTAYRESEINEEPDDGFQCEEIDNESEMPPIESLPNNKFSMLVPVPRQYIPFIIGAKGKTIKRISNDTSCNILVKKFDDKQKFLINGKSKRQVILAWKRINYIINASRKKLPVTHFISIPVNGEEIKKNFLKFKEDVLSKYTARGVSEELFSTPEQLHTTIVVFVLADDNERKKVEEKFLQVCNEVVRPMIEGKKPLIMEVKGLDYMNDDPSNVSVLYANPSIKNDERFLQQMSDAIFNKFKNLDLIKREASESVKLHATIMKTSLDDNGDKSELNQKKERPTFDATDIIRDFKDYYFGECELRSIHLSTRFTVDKDGYYKHAAIVEL